MIPKLDEDCAILQMDSVIRVGSRRLMYSSTADCLRASVPCSPFLPMSHKSEWGIVPQRGSLLCGRWRRIDLSLYTCRNSWVGAGRTVAKGTKSFLQSFFDAGSLENLSWLMNWKIFFHQAWPSSHSYTAQYHSPSCSTRIRKEQLPDIHSIHSIRNQFHRWIENILGSRTFIPWSAIQEKSVHEALKRRTEWPMRATPRAPQIICKITRRQKFNREICKKKTHRRPKKSARKLSLNVSPSIKRSCQVILALTEPIDKKGNSVNKTVSGMRIPGMFFDHEHWVGTRRFLPRSQYTSKGG